MKRLLFITVVALAAAPIARGGDVAMVARDVPLGQRSVQSASPPMRFNMLGVHWAGRGSVEYRTHRLHGAWGSWRAVDDDARPDAGSREGDRAWRDGNLDWTGASDASSSARTGRCAGCARYYLWSQL